MRVVDKSKKANIKCEYCGHFNGSDMCILKAQERNYWNRCKEFVWREDKRYKEATNGHS